MKKFLSVFLSMVLILGLCGCNGNKSANQTNTSQNNVQETLIDSKMQATQTGNQEVSIERTSFLDYAPENSYEIFTEPDIVGYEISEDFSNVINRDDYAYLLENYEEVKERLLTDGFVVLEGSGSEFFSLYETNRYCFTPNFVTTDAMLHTYHLYFSHLLKGLEKEYFYDDLKVISEEMVKESLAQYEVLKGTEWEAAALRNVAYFSVGLKLLDEDAAVNELVSDIVSKELALIESEAGIEISPLMSWENSCEDLLKEDYTQYKVRGYYAEDELLSKYFQAMMWYGRITFRLCSDEETRSAVLITKAMQSSNSLVNWNRIYDVTSFFMGNSDDAGIYDYAPVIENVYAGEGVGNFVANNDRWNALKDELGKLQPPQVNSIPVYEYEDKDIVISGFRFMGQRETFDATVFGQLIYSETGFNSNGGKRMLPSALDVPAVLGSEEAQKILTENGAFEYEKYPENLKRLQDTVKDSSEDIWSANLYNSWINTLRPLLTEKEDGYPQFMTNDAWTRKQLNTFLGSFAELKHDSVLYSKQVYAEMGGGDIDEPDYRGYVEPQPQVYARLATLCQYTRQGLLGYGMLSQEDEKNLSLLQELCEKLLVISNKELAQMELTEEEHELIKSFGGQLEHFWYEALKDQAVDGYISPQEYPAAVITDIATNPEGSVLEIGTGGIDRILVVVDVEGSLRIAEGGVYSFYEFEQPINERLTDKEWRVKLGLDFPDGPDGMPDFSYRPEDVEQPEWVNEFKIDIY